MSATPTDLEDIGKKRMYLYMYTKCKYSYYANEVCFDLYRSSVSSCYTICCCNSRNICLHLDCDVGAMHEKVRYDMHYHYRLLYMYNNILVLHDWYTMFEHVHLCLDGSVCSYTTLCIMICRILLLCNISDKRSWKPISVPSVNI